MCNLELLSKIRSHYFMVCVHRFVSVMVTTRAMIATGVNLAIMDQTVANHRFSLDGQLPPTVMRNGKS